MKEKNICAYRTTVIPFGIWHGPVYYAILEVGHPGIRSRDKNILGTVIGIYLHFLWKIRFFYFHVPNLLGSLSLRFLFVTFCIVHLFLHLFPVVIVDNLLWDF